MIAAVYLRVSTERQDEANQEPECLRLCAGRGWEPRVFRERESGAKHRPGWDRVVEAARVGEVGAVVFWAVDRVGRTRVEVMKDLWNLARFGVAIASCREKVVDIPRADSNTSPLLVIVREQAIAWLTFAAEDERVKLIERTRAGIARARASGVRLGRPSAMPPAARARAKAAYAEKPSSTPGDVRRLLKAEGLGDFSRRTVQRAMEG